MNTMTNKYSLCKKSINCAIANFKIRDPKTHLWMPEEDLGDPNMFIGFFPIHNNDILIKICKFKFGQKKENIFMFLHLKTGYFAAIKNAMVTKI